MVNFHVTYVNVCEVLIQFKAEVEIAIGLSI